MGLYSQGSLLALSEDIRVGKQRNTLAYNNICYVIKIIVKAFLSVAKVESLNRADAGN